MTPPLNDDAWNLLLRHSRSQNRWLDKPVAPELLTQLYELMKMGPTASNCGPARLIFLCSDEAKARLLPLMAEGNRDKTRQAPVTVLLGMARHFQRRLPELFPHRPNAREAFDANLALREAVAFRNSSLQGGYLMLAARGLGLDCGPMSGFDAAAVNAEFFNKAGEEAFAGEGVVINFICNLGHGDPAGVFDRLPRLPFDQACRVW
nr:malonic semialdehyde reductase [uncultured Roseateles sp.]